MSRGRPWVTTDEAKLSELWLADASIGAISNTLGRTVGACIRKARTLHLTPRNHKAAMGILRRNAERRA